MSKVTHVEIRMYRLGTGDCFALKFFSGSKKDPTFKILIDAGTWSGSKEHLEPYIEDLKSYLNNYADVLVITHEHKDHVYAFDACEELFIDGKFKVGDIWMAWTENDKIKKVKEWQKTYGEQKKALGKAAKKLKTVVEGKNYKTQFAGNRNEDRAFAARALFSNALSGFAELHLSADKEGNYKGGLTGMEIVKNKIEKEGSIKYFNPGDIIEDIDGAGGLKIYVLGPPKLYEDVKKEAGEEGESYRHNDKLREIKAFTNAITTDDDEQCPSNILPFDENYIDTSSNNTFNEYAKDEWRKIDTDWLFSAGSFGLRMMGLTNNLSLALAFEFEGSGKVILFPGDAEYGSWASWHKIKWAQNGKDGKHLSEDLLNRTVFYKVAHHLSHNGTAQKQGLEMMSHKDLAAMATLDYDAISTGWKNTMPNRAIIKELLKRTKGRLMILREEGLFYDFDEKEPISEKIKEARSSMTKRENDAFQKAYKETELYIEYIVNVE